jgi:hypothetical protein
MITRTVNKTGVEAIQTKTATGTPVKDLALAIANNQGIGDVSEGKSISLFPLPDTTTVTISNPKTAGKSADVTAYFFNEQLLKNTKDDNTYGAGAADADKPTVTYNDGFSGRVIDKLIQSLNGGRGMRCKQITVIGKNDSGVQDDGAILVMDPSVKAFNALRGRSVDFPYDFRKAIRNTQFKDGLLTLNVDFWLNMVSQFTFTCPIGYSYEITFEWDYSNAE